MFTIQDNSSNGESEFPTPPAKFSAAEFSADKPNSYSLPLYSQHRSELEASGLTMKTVTENGIYSESDASKIAKLLNWSDKRAKNLRAVLVYPHSGPDGLSLDHAVIKPDNPRPRSDKPGIIKYENPKNRPTRVYIPFGARAAVNDPSTSLIITEGCKKALSSTQNGLPCISLAGVWNWVASAKEKKKSGIKELHDDLKAIKLQGRKVFLCFDSDAMTNQNVLTAEKQLARSLGKAGADVFIVRLPAEEDGRKNGIDDYLLRHGVAAFRSHLAAAVPVEKPSATDDDRAADDRCTIRLGADEHRVNDEVCAQLAEVDSIYQRLGELVRINAEQIDENGPRVSTTPRIERIPSPALRDLISRQVKFVNKTEEGDRAAHPPVWSVSAVESRGMWPGVQQLTGVVSFPIMRPDGSILTKPGYDTATGLYLHWPGKLPPIPERPTLEDARFSIDVLLDVVSDFPFQHPRHKAAWLASLFTPVCRPAINGPSPLFMVEGNVRGIGKGLLLSVNSHILLGEPFPVMSYPVNLKDREEELRKKITTAVMYGDRLILFDNLTRNFGDGTLDRALTCTEWQDRKLGSNTQFRGSMEITFFATGNNISMEADTSRRVCEISLESPEEHPEEREGFKRGQLIQWVIDNRLQLLSHVFTVLRAYHLAGRPIHEMKPWGSFENWSGIIRNMLLWCGLADPGEARLSIRAINDEALDGIRMMLDVLPKIDKEKKGKTASELIRLFDEKDPTYFSVTVEIRAELRAAIEALGCKLNANSLGCKLRPFKRRVIDGLFIDLAEMKAGSNRWKVFGKEHFSIPQTAPVEDKPVTIAAVPEEGEI